MKFTQTSLPGVIVVEPEAFADERGYFMESLRVDWLAEQGVTRPFVQENQSGSQIGTLRGLHFQLKQPQAKLCRAVSGEVLDVVVDIRIGSPTFGQHVTVLLTAENKKQIYIPRNFAHGFVVLTPYAEFLYKCDDYYDPADQHGIAWDDPYLAIEWQLNSNVVLSNKDRQNPTLKCLGAEDLPSFFE
jgi:dTDP-4-dehydrorhamnose 3,5-epimerase